MVVDNNNNNNNRQASIDNQTPPLSNDKENNSTTAPSDIEGNSSIVEHLRTEDHLDSTRASKRLRLEYILNTTPASEHAPTEESPFSWQERAQTKGV